MNDLSSSRLAPTSNFFNIKNIAPPSDLETDDLGRKKRRCLPSQDIKSLKIIVGDGEVRNAFENAAARLEEPEFDI